jgi:hypothetical protein
MKLLIPMVLCAATLAALDKQSEAALRNQLAAVQADHAQALKNNAALSLALEKATKAGAAATTEAVKESGRTAAGDAQGAKFDASTQAYLIQQAAEAAARAAATAQAQQNQRYRLDLWGVFVPVATSTLLLIGVLAGFRSSRIAREQDHEWAIEAKAEALAAVKEAHDLAVGNSKIIEEVRHHTNSLVEKLEAQAHKRGMDDEAAAEEKRKGK